MSPVEMQAHFGDISGHHRRWKSQLQTCASLPVLTSWHFLFFFLIGYFTIPQHVQANQVRPDRTEVGKYQDKFFFHVYLVLFVFNELFFYTLVCTITTKVLLIIVVHFTVMTTDKVQSRLAVFT